MRKLLIAAVVLAMGMSVVVSCGNTATGGDWKAKMAKVESLTTEMLELVMKAFTGDTNAASRIETVGVELEKLGAELDAIYPTLSDAEKKAFDAEKERIEQGLKDSGLGM
ncbi:MAG: hypothetical protein A2Y33_08050 [Spirochaetes bacterium GWF1_51_8]|nr:MAG: hypothetical protein A2Y33_08050 [Spirochaetes bacterium GWF1_51_8]